MSKNSSSDKPVTKNEATAILKAYPTKSDLNQALKSYATKSDLKKTVKGSERVLRIEILKVEERVGNIEEGQKRMETTLNKISNQLDGFVGRVDDLTNDNEIGTAQIHELRETARNHESRISKLESAN